MPFKLLFVAATSVEANAISKITGIQVTPEGFRLAGFEMSSLVAGVGSVSTSWEMQKWIFSNYKPDLAINIGIAGSYRDDITIGDVVMPLTDCFADAGIEDGNNFLTLSEAGLAHGSEFPYRGGVIHADQYYIQLLKEIVKPVTAITVNTSTGSEATRNKLAGKFNPDIETMEGATFFYICSREKIPFLALRGVSNRVEVRNKDKWDINLALSSLGEKLDEVVLKLK
jgi:futalosine hydrolase